MLDVKRYSVPGLVCLLLIAGTGCPPKKPVIDESAEAPKAPADTSFTEAVPMSIDTSDDATFREADLEAELARKVRENLKPVYFEFNSYSLTSNSADQLSTAASFLLEQPDMRVLIEGHCDERGSSEYNMGLGENRARAVKSFLENYGIPSVRLETTSWGKEKPAREGCRDESCHQENRRAEFSVLAR
jgi:peptidoglycan-associated lipoprotein